MNVIGTATPLFTAPTYLIHSLVTTACYTCLIEIARGAQALPHNLGGNRMIGRFSRSILALLVAIIAIGASFGSASAAPATPPKSPAKADLALSRTYKAEQNRLKLQDARLTRAQD